MEIKEKIEKLRSEQVKDFGARLVNNKLEIENIEKDIEIIKKKIFLTNILAAILLLSMILLLFLDFEFKFKLELELFYINIIVYLIFKNLGKKLEKLEISLSYEKRLSIVEDFYVAQLRETMEEMVNMSVKGGK